MSDLKTVCHEITGQNYTPDQILMIKRRVLERLRDLKIENFSNYKKILYTDSSELAKFTSLCTIHTTSWFREPVHFDILEAEISKRMKSFTHKPFKVLSTACSTGEEVFSTALRLEQIRKKYPQFDYQVHGFDIDPISINKAIDAIYPLHNFENFQLQYKQDILIGQKSHSGYFKLGPEIRKRCFFKKDNLMGSMVNIGQYDWIFCRNALIYFDEKSIIEILKKLSAKLNKDAFLCLGHSDHFDHKSINMNLVEHSVYQKNSEVIGKNKFSLKDKKQKNLLILDDSKTVRSLLKQLLNSLEINLFFAQNTKEADALLKKEDIHSLCVDLYMPNENGDEWLKRIHNKGIKLPSVIVSDAKPEDAPQIYSCLQSKYADSYFSKSDLNEKTKEFKDLIEALCNKQQEQRILLKKKKISNKSALLEKKPEFILIGASTGGTGALSEVLSKLPKDHPPVFVVQHITKEFAGAFANRLAEISGLHLAAIDKPTQVKNGHLYMSDNESHLQIEKNKSQQLIARLSPGPKVSGHCPSVDSLFQSAAKIKNSYGLAILMTGMGRDGASGLLQLKENGHFTVGQDQESSIVFGMPKVAQEIGATQSVLNLQQISNLLRNLPVVRHKVA